MPSLTDLHQSLARVELHGRGLEHILSDIVTIARAQVPAVEAASITLIRGEKAHTAAYDGQMALDADEMQYERGYGPCLDAGRAGLTLLIDDMATEERWPDYTRNALTCGVGSSLSIPLPFQSTTIGALNTYSSRPHAFTEEDYAQGQEIAGWIALVVGHADLVARTGEEVEQLRTAMRSRAAIEQAKGILMERFKLNPDQAFAVLTRASQTSNVKLRVVALQLVESGVLPGIG